MSKGKTEVNLRSGRYAILMTQKRWKISLVFYVILGTAAYTYLLFNSMENHQHWGTLILPIAIIGLLFVFFPLTEAWFYGPWQGKNQRYERHIKG